MIEQKIAKEIVREFFGMPKTPETKSEIDQRVNAMARHARTAGHARRVALHLLETLAWYPTVAEIVHACEYTPDDTRALRERIDCPWCHGDGFRSVEGPYGTSAAYPCDHRGTESNLGVVIPAVVESQYKREHQGIPERRAAHAAYAAAHPRKILRRVDRSDVAKILEHLG